MTGTIDGPWRLDLARRLPDESFGDLILEAGTVSVAAKGRPVGVYHIEPGLLTISIPMPESSDRGQWRMDAKFLLFDPSSLPDRLPGMVQIFDAIDTVMSTDACALVRHRE